MVVEIPDGELQSRCDQKMLSCGSRADLWWSGRCMVFSLVDAVEDKSGIRLSVPIACTMSNLSYNGSPVSVERRHTNRTHAVLIRV